MSRKLDVLEKLRRQRPESEALAAILDYLTLVPGVRIRRIRELAGADGRYHQGGVEGEPDLQGWVKLEFLKLDGAPISLPLFIECKRSGPRGRRRGMQRAFIEQARADGCIALFADCVEDIRAELKRWNVRCP